MERFTSTKVYNYRGTIVNDPSHGTIHISKKIHFFSLWIMYYNVENALDELSYKGPNTYPSIIVSHYTMNLFVDIYI